MGHCRAGLVDQSARRPCRNRHRRNGTECERKELTEREFANTAEPQRHWRNQPTNHGKCQHDQCREGENVTGDPGRGTERATLTPRRRNFRGLGSPWARHRRMAYETTTSTTGIANETTSGRNRMVAIPSLQVTNAHRLTTTGATNHQPSCAGRGSGGCNEFASRA